MATERQLELLIKIVGTYVKNGEPVSSANVLENNHDLKLSSATIRNEMVELENEKYLFKLDSSSSRTSGRIPTDKGYKYYLENLKTNPNSIVSIKSKLDEILKERKNNIDNTLKEAINLISEFTNTLTITKENNFETKILDINLYPKGENKAIIIIVTTEGDVVNNEIELKETSFEDFSKVINAFSKRLKDVRIKDLDNTTEFLKDIFKINADIMEDRFQDMIKVMFSKLINVATNYQGLNSLVTTNSVNIQEQIKQIFRMIENNSIWDLINDEGSIETDTNGVTVDMNLIDGMSVINKSINYGDKNKHLTILGSKNQDYEKIFSILEYLDEKLKE